MRTFKLLAPLTSTAARYKSGQVPGGDWPDQPVLATCRVTQPVQVFPMRVFDLAKATLLCGGVAYFAYSIPALSQAIIIAILTLLWLSYLHTTLSRLRARWPG